MYSQCRLRWATSTLAVGQVIGAVGSVTDDACRHISAAGRHGMILVDDIVHLQVKDNLKGRRRSCANMGDAVILNHEGLMPIVGCRRLSIDCAVAQVRTEDRQRFVRLALCRVALRGHVTAENLRKAGVAVGGDVEF